MTTYWIANYSDSEEFECPEAWEPDSIEDAAMPRVIPMLFTSYTAALDYAEKQWKAVMIDRWEGEPEEDQAAVRTRLALLRIENEGSIRRFWARTPGDIFGKEYVEGVCYALEVEVRS